MADFKTKFSKFWSNFTLKMSLFKVWFFKNIRVFLMWAVIIYAAFVLTGNATGGILFGELSKEIAEATSATTTGDILMNLLTVFLSLGSGCLLIWRKSKPLALKDIKNKKLKKAMIAAGMYFNANGKLTKRVEHTLKVDIDGDGKVNETPIEEAEKPASESLIKSTIVAVQEFGTILTTKIEDQSDVEKILTPELKEMKEVIDKTETDARPEVEKIEDKLIEETVEDTFAESTEDKEIVKSKKNIFTSILQAFKSKKKTIQEKIDELPVEETDSKEEIADEKAAAKKEKKTKKEETIEVIVKEPEAPKTEKVTIEKATGVLSDEEKKKLLEEKKKKAILDRLNSLYK